MSKELPSKVVTSGAKHFSHSLLFLLHVAGVGSKQMGYMNRIGPHFQRHPRPAMNWFLVAARKGVSADASAKKLHSSVLLSVNAKENVEELDHAKHNRLQSFNLCKSAKK
jgi:hypothetical protein